MKYKVNPYLHSIFAILHFEISSLMSFISSLFQTGRKIQFKLEKNPVHQTRYFKMENCKNQGVKGWVGQNE